MSPTEGQISQTEAGKTVVLRLQEEKAKVKREVVVPPSVHPQAETPTFIWSSFNEGEVGLKLRIADERHEVFNRYLVYSSSEKINKILLFNKNA